MVMMIGDDAGHCDMANVMVMMIDDAGHGLMTRDRNLPGLPYLGEAKSWSCLATGLRFVARHHCTGKGHDQQNIMIIIYIMTISSVDMVSRIS